MKTAASLVVLVGSLLTVQLVHAESYNLVVLTGTNPQGKVTVTLASALEPQPQTNLSVQGACEVLRQLKGSGSAVHVLIVSKDAPLATKDLKDLVQAIAENPWLRLAYVRNGIDATTAESIIKATNVERSVAPLPRAPRTGHSEGER